MARRNLARTNQVGESPTLKNWGGENEWLLLNKVYGETERFFRSTKGYEIEGVGVIVNVSVYDSGAIAETTTFVPGVKIVAVTSGEEVIGRKLEAL